MATNTHHAAPNWATQRHYLTEALKHLSAFTDNMQTFLELADQDEYVRVEQQLQFDSTNTTLTVVPEPERRSWEMVDVPKKNKKWTSTEEELVVAGRLLGLTHKEIGDRIGRSERSVMSHCTDMRAEGRL